MKQVAISETINIVVFRILQRMLGTPKFVYQKGFLLSKYKDTSIWHQRAEAC